MTVTGRVICSHPMKHDNIEGLPQTDQVAYHMTILTERYNFEGIYPGVPPVEVDDYVSVEISKKPRYTDTRTARGQKKVINITKIPAIA